MAEGGYSEPNTDGNYLKDNNLYTIKRSTQCSSITITFRFHEIYSKFERIIFKQYPGKLFKRLKENHLNQIWYSFYNKNGEKVCITLSKSTITLVIQGKGCKKWLDEESGELGKQLQSIIKVKDHNSQNTPEQIVEPKLPQSNTGQQPSKGVPSQQEEQGQHISKQPSTSTVTSQLGKEFKVDRSFEDIMSLNYGKNPIVQKNEDLNSIIDYRFKFRGKDVCLTLSPGAAYSILNVDGNGGDTWWNEANSILYKQCERLQSGKLKLPGAKTGENKKELVSEEKIHKCFAIPYAYGTNGPKWSRETILLYKYSSNATTKYWNIPEYTWKKIVNTNKHAEEIMIEDLENILDYLTIQPDDNEGSYKAILSVEVILSYSPCYVCSDELCKIKQKLDEKVNQSNIGNKSIDIVLKKISALSLTQEVDKEEGEEEEEKEEIKFKITFSNFYKHLEKMFSTGKQNIEGLKSLLKRDVKLDVFTHDNWDYFFNAAGLVAEIPQRRQREKDDKKILQYLEDSVAFERMQAALKATKLDMRKNKLL